jgi:hypothetical protein
MVNGLSKAAQFVVAPEPRQENRNATLEVKQGPKGKQVLTQPDHGACWIRRLAIVLSISAFAAYNITAARLLLASGRTTSCHQRMYCAPFCPARYQPRVIAHVVIQQVRLSAQRCLRPIFDSLI